MIKRGGYCFKRGSSVRIVSLFFFGVLSLLTMPMGVHACTIGVANGYATTDNRPILWKVSDIVDDNREQLIYVSGSPYNYISVVGIGDPIYMGLNEAGVASGNSYVWSPGGWATNSELQLYILENFSSVDQIRDYIQQEVNDKNKASGCFPFIDAAGNAVIFEVKRSWWWREYDSIDPDRAAQGLYGFVVRANEFHDQTDGTDDTSIDGRYESGTYNTLGLVDIGQLCARTIIQGDSENGFEFARYGPDQPLASISRSINRSTITMHGVAPGEDPALTTMWVILGQSNYGIAVPAWVKVSNIPECLISGDMYDRTESLYGKGNETTTQASIFPVEAHMFDVVVNTLLPHWRAAGVPSISEMTRIEHRMANDAYSLLDCLDNRQSNNKAPQVSFNALPNGLTMKFSLVASDSDGSINDIEWNFGDEQTSTEASPEHTYAGPGTYLISCTVTDDDGVSITDWKYFTVPIDCDIAGDDGMVNLSDFAKLSGYWLETGCKEPNWCTGTDFDRTGTVNFADLVIFVNHWLEGAE